MAPVLNVLLEILRILRFARNCIKRFPGRRASLQVLALLGRKLTAWWCFWRGKLGSYGRQIPAKHPFVGTESSSYSASGNSAAAGGYLVAASGVPASASHPGPSLHERRSRASTPLPLAQEASVVVPGTRVLFALRAAPVTGFQS